MPGEIGDPARARKSLESYLGWMERVPHATESMLVAAMMLLELEPEAAPPTPEAAQAPKPAELSVSLHPKEIVAGEANIGHGSVVVEVPEGLHINSNSPPARWLTSTEVSIVPLKADIQYPDAVEDKYFGRVEIPFTVTLPAAEGGA